MLFIHITTGLLATIALLSLGNNFPESRLFIVIILIGLSVSGWQQKKNRAIRYLKPLLNIIFIVLTVKALLPFSNINEPSDILSGLVKTWMYFLVLSTFIIHSKRDYYFTQVLSLGLIVFSCFDKAAPKILLLNFILAFFIIWTFTLRGIGLVKDIEVIKQTFHPPRWLLQEIKNGILFTLIIITLAIPLYLLIPHFNITIPFLSRFVEQKPTITTSDFLGKSIMSLLGRGGDKLSLSPIKEEKATAEGISKEIKTEPGFIKVEKIQTKPTLWHSIEEYENINLELSRQIEEIQKEISKINKEARIQEVWIRKEALQKKLKSLKRQKRQLNKLLAQVQHKDLEKEKPAKKVPLYELLLGILTLVMFSILLFLIYRIISFFLSYLKQKNKFKRASRESEHSLAIILLYNFLSRVLNIFGYSYPVAIDPEEYSILVSRRFKTIETECEQITAIFLEARYSTHMMIKERLEKALNSYRKILKELTHTGTFWQSTILKLDFVFGL